MKVSASDQIRDAITEVVQKEMIQAVDIINLPFQPPGNKRQVRKKRGETAVV
jgi:hypothetical protein